MIKMTKDKTNNNIESKIEKDFYYMIIKRLGLAVILLLGLLVFIVMKKIPDSYLNQVMIGLGFGGVLLTFSMYKLINNTVGFGFLTLLFKAKKMKKKGYGILKEFNLSSRPKYHIVKYDDIIRYNTTIGGEDKKGFALYHPFAKYEDFGCNVPFIEATYNDISLKNFLTGNRIGMNPDLADKIIVESGISKQDLDDVKKHRKWLLYLLAGIAIAGIISFDLFADRLAEANRMAMECFKENSKSATIIAGGFVKSGVDKIRGLYYEKE